MPPGAFTSVLGVVVVVHVPLVFFLTSKTFLTFLPAPALFLAVLMVCMVLLVLPVLMVLLVLPVLMVLVLLVLLVLPALAIAFSHNPSAKDSLATEPMRVPTTRGTTQQHTVQAGPYRFRIARVTDTSVVCSVDQRGRAGGARG